MAFPSLRFPPCLAVFLSFHIPQQIAMARSTKHGYDSVHLCNCHITSINVHCGLISKGKTNLLVDHISLALSQSQKRWQVDSNSFPHESQMQSTVIFLFFRFSFVARMFLQAFQVKCLNLFGTFIFHRRLHVCFKAKGSELSGALPSDCMA